MAALPEACEARSVPSTQLRGGIPLFGMDADTALDVVTGRLGLGCPPERNLATFLTTSIEPEAQRLYRTYLNHNLVDREQYPAIDAMLRECVGIIGSLWHGEPHRVAGSATTGSSEAALLAGASLLRNWQERGATRRPNLVMGAGAHACWAKFCRHWDVEARVAPARGDSPSLDPDEVEELCDGGTIGVVGILGSTLDGRYEPIAAIADALDRLQERTGLDIPMHVDAASGGFLAPFLDPDLAWDFRIPRVVSINASGHKSGMVPPGLGWVLWRGEGDRNQGLGVRVNYLGGDDAHHELTFSRSAAPVVLQYYNFVRYGFAGFHAVHARSRGLARRLAERMRATGRLRLLGDGGELPVVAVTARPPVALRELAAHLAERGWAVPVYTLPPHLEHVEVMRVVVRSDLTPASVEELATTVEEFVAGAR
ncbi:glutamate decarboxylase [Saccharopolyspora sp. TS4A08]|uniref:Glutamate decarboxylase n=1 Tax=Saccharopolyspora ipomoeae TaxID=3042027 RepID=A0ABT6PQ19_9PSEU|nr:glutamate decarboxylase [Saccharopolyspora sp. TS4A08]MDI2030106.1 glutamate decarboxylase [Saccharopolyspora sp. TS4A08]